MPLPVTAGRVLVSLALSLVALGLTLVALPLISVAAASHLVALSLGVRAGRVLVSLPAREPADELLGIDSESTKYSSVLFMVDPVWQLLCRLLGLIGTEALLDL